MKLETLAIHAGYSPDPTTKAVAVPIYQTSSFAFDDTQHGADLFDLKVAGQHLLADHEPDQRRARRARGGAGRRRRRAGVASGMAAITYAIQTVAEAGDNIVSVAKLYGGTYNLLAHTLPRFGIQVRFAAHDDIAVPGSADRRQDQGGVLRIDRQPGRQHRRYRRPWPTPRIATACR